METLLKKGAEFSRWFWTANEISQAAFFKTDQLFPSGKSTLHDFLDAREFALKRRSNESDGLKIQPLLFYFAHFIDVGFCPD